ncbi:MAG: hypothetical protein KKH01_00735 [Firmicutes bacterium]|nr:hypothetical protein [Bacillota bacterium]
MRKVPKIKELFLRDYLVLGPTLFSVIFIGLALYFYFVDHNLNGFYGLSVLGVISILVVLVRLYILKKLFQTGIDVSGKITKVSFYRGMCRFTMEFDYDSQHIKTSWIANKNQATRDIRNIVDVKVLANPRRPKQAVILDLFKQ